jgi:hypothetical protein
MLIVTVLDAYLSRDTDLVDKMVQHGLNGGSLCGYTLRWAV